MGVDDPLVYVIYGQQKFMVTVVVTFFFFDTEPMNKKKIMVTMLEVSILKITPFKEIYAYNICLWPRLLVY